MLSLAVEQLLNQGKIMRKTVCGLLLALTLSGCSRHYSEAECQRIINGEESVFMAMTDSSSPLSVSERESAMKRCLTDKKDRAYLKCVDKSNGAQDVAKCVREHNARH
jgi:hypothetical protein